MPPAVEVQSVASGPRRIEVHVHLFCLHEAASRMIYQSMQLEYYVCLQSSSALVSGTNLNRSENWDFRCDSEASATTTSGLVTWSSKWFQQRILPGKHHISHISWLIYCILLYILNSDPCRFFDLLLIFLFTWFGGVWGGAQNHLSFLQMPKTNRISWAIVLAHHLIFQTNVHFQDLKTTSKGGQ